ncbi:hypothetical protein EXIGLDRAFT_830386 [Exidia glandulosa HHB12029]|uniref:F-box domain-containing protein n=1 Tax=Exidia glandulosa HHB12029 TaxID=1314781 RepID=A0A165NMJ7_EXIGL|nr:hypothetical protein EXIGLDRAFT_830386 [Exidia glandulosa HHB12029]
MSVNLQEYRRQRIRAERKDMARLLARMDQLHRDRENAQAAFNPARRALGEVELVVTGVTNQLYAARLRLDPILLAYRADFMATIPPDVMRCIFTELAHHDEFGQGDEHQTQIHHRSHYLTTTPFSVASLQPWRSRNAPLDVAMEAQAFDEGGQLENQVITALTPSIPRWRTAEIRTVQLLGALTALPILTLPTPILERMILVWSSAMFYSLPDSRVLGGLLPSAPRLEEMHISSAMPIGTRPRAVYPSLASVVWASFGLEHAWTVLSASAQRLETLSLLNAQFTAPPLSPALTPITLPNLRNLHLATSIPDVAAFCLLLSMPRLQNLSVDIYHDQLPPEFARFFEAVSSSVGALVLSGRLNPSHTAILRLLGNVQNVCLQNAHGVSDSLFADITAVDAQGTPIWPMLEELSFSGGSFTADESEGLLRFVEARTAAGLDDQSSPRRLKAILLDNFITPAWLRVEVERRMSAV